MVKVNVQKKAVLNGHKDAVYGLVSYVGTQFISAGSDGFVVLWDSKDAVNGKLLAKVSQSVYAIFYNEETNELLIGENFDSLHLVNCNDKKLLESVKLTNGAVFDIQKVKNNFWVACGDGTILVFDSGLNLLFSKQLSMKSARCIAESNQGVFVGYSDGFIREFDFSGELIRELAAHENSVFTINFDRNKQELFSTGRDAHLKKWAVGNEIVLQKDVVAHMYTINHLTFSPDRNYFVTCSMDKTIKVWESESLRLLKVIDKSRYASHGTSVNRLLWLEETGEVISCSDDRTITIWDINIEQNQ